VAGARRGRVVAFDAHRGLGAVEDSGGERYEFHCTRIADGSRTIPVGAMVRFDVVAHSLGRWEAEGLEVVPEAG